MSKAESREQRRQSRRATDALINQNKQDRQQSHESKHELVCLLLEPAYEQLLGVVVE